VHFCLLVLKKSMHVGITMKRRNLLRRVVWCVIITGHRGKVGV
jgi:hypothetical protein